MSDDHKDRFPKLSDGVSPDWRTWKQRVMPGLYGKTSAAYPDKNLRGARAGAGGGFQLPCNGQGGDCLLYTSPSPRDQRGSRMPSSA